MDVTIAALLRAYRNRELTPTEVVAAVGARCERYTAHNLWITRLSTAQVQPYLDRLQTISPESLPLYGIPFAIKDNIDLAGVPTTAACAAFSYTPAHSAFAVERLIEAGAIPIGKTNMDQFATGLVGTRSPWGPCRNAFDAEYISGGSSSGSAVAVALGIVAFSLGTDTAGSGRVPAAFNNIVGVKPTKGLLSMRGVVPACRSLDCMSIFALTADDANTVFEQVAVYDQGDDYARRNRFDNNAHHYGTTQGPFRFGVPSPALLNFFGDAASQELCTRSIAKLEEIGGEKIEIDFSPFIAAARLLYEGPWVAERYVAIESLIALQPDVLLPVIRSIVGDARTKTALETFKAQYQLQHYRAHAQRELERVDFIVTPTAGTIYTIDAVQADSIRLNSNLGYYTNFMNLLDCAGVAMPAGFLENGLPWGISLVAPALQDRKLLSFANRWQQALALPLGALAQPVEPLAKNNVTHIERIPVIVCGAHLEGLPLNWQLRERGAVLLERTHTAPHYKMYALAGGPPYRPGLIRDKQNGAAIEVEVWAVPKEEFGTFVAAIPAPLAIGKVELPDGRWLPGFVCEAYGIKDAEDITHLKRWRTYIGRAQ